MAEKLEVIIDERIVGSGENEDFFAFYRVGEWCFDEEDKDLAYIDSAIAAWTAWREYVKGGA